MITLTVGLSRLGRQYSTINAALSAIPRNTPLLDSYTVKIYNDGFTYNESISLPDGDIQATVSAQLFITGINLPVIFGSRPFYSTIPYMTLSNVYLKNDGTIGSGITVYGDYSSILNVTLDNTLLSSGVEMGISCNNILIDGLNLIPVGGIGAPGAYQTVYIVSSTSCVIRNCFLPISWNFIIDNMAGDLKFYNNVMAISGGNLNLNSFQAGSSAEIYNNVVSGIWLPSNSGSFSVKNNILTGGNVGNVFRLQVFTSNLASYHIDYNLYAGQSEYFDIFDLTAQTSRMLSILDYKGATSWVALSAAAGYPQDVHSFGGNFSLPVAGFTGTGQRQDAYKLVVSSICRRKGTDGTSVAPTDFYGNTRKAPFNLGAIDIGRDVLTRAVV